MDSVISLGADTSAMDGSHFGWRLVQLLLMLLLLLLFIVGSSYDDDVVVFAMLLVLSQFLDL
jgi:hypothetical protein